MRDPTTTYFEFFESQNEAIDHCRRKNAGLSSKAAQFAIIDGPGCDAEEHPQGCQCCAYAVVDIETAREHLEGSGISALIATD